VVAVLSYSLAAGEAADLSYKDARGALAAARPYVGGSYSGPSSCPCLRCLYPASGSQLKDERVVVQNLELSSSLVWAALVAAVVSLASVVVSPPPRCCPHSKEGC